MLLNNSVTDQIEVFWDVAKGRPVGVYRHCRVVAYILDVTVFRGRYLLH
jgi:hypothetical protein